MYPSGTTYRNPPRGILWVLAHGTILVIFLAAAMHAWQFVELIAAHQQLAGIAKAAVREAILPDTNRSRIEQIVVGRLRRAGIRPAGRAITIEQNGQTARRYFWACSGDRFAVSITVPASAILPTPLGRWSDLFGPADLHAHAIRTVGSSHGSACH